MHREFEEGKYLQGNKKKGTIKQEELKKKKNHTHVYNRDRQGESLCQKKWHIENGEKAASTPVLGVNTQKKFRKPGRRSSTQGSPLETRFERSPQEEGARKKSRDGAMLKGNLHRKGHCPDIKKGTRENDKLQICT